jgi:putative transposase
MTGWQFPPAAIPSQTSRVLLLGKHGLLKSLTKRAVERVLEAELTAHLGYAPHVRHGTEEQNARNGKG